MKDVMCEACGHTSKVGNRRKKDIACWVCGNPIKMKKPQVKKRARKKTVKKADTKITKTVRSLKAVFNGLKVVVKWANKNVTMKMAVTVVSILLFVSTVISSYLSAVF